MRPVTVLATLPLLLAFASLAEPLARAADPAAAQALFDDGKKLMSQRRYAEACDKFTESQRLDPGVGTLFHLADCEERSGKTATAWATFLEVASDAKAIGQADRAAAARERAAVLESKIGRLTIDPGADANAAELVILRDGAPLGKAQWATAVPVDPGTHAIEVRARAKGTWSSTVEVAPGGAVVVTVPLLTDVPVQSLPEPGALPAESHTAITTTTAAEVPGSGSHGRGNAQRAAGLAVGAAGVVGLGIGAYFGVVSLQHHDDAASHCGANGCDATGVSLRDDARQAGTAATIALASGGGALVVGLVTYLAAPRSSPPATTVSIVPGGVVLRGVF